MLEKVTQSPTVNILSQALHAANLRHNVISNNIANVNTPNFKKSEVDFESMLAEKLFPKPKPETKLQMLRTNEKHLPMPMQEVERNIAPQIRLVDSTTMRTDGNNVDIDAEMAELSKNNIYYSASVRQLSSHFTSLKSVISGQK